MAQRTLWMRGKTIVRAKKKKKLCDKRTLWPMTITMEILTNKGEFYWGTTLGQRTIEN